MREATQAEVTDAIEALEQAEREDEIVVAEDHVSSES